MRHGQYVHCSRLLHTSPPLSLSFVPWPYFTLLLSMRTVMRLIISTALFLLLPISLGEAKKTKHGHETSADILKEIKRRYSMQKISKANHKLYLGDYHRNYWIGERYYDSDPLANRATRDTCVYSLRSGVNVFYEDGRRVLRVLFQCRKKVDKCCELDCCPAAAAASGLRPTFLVAFAISIAFFVAL